MGTTWGPDAKNHQKSEQADPPQEVPKEVIFEHVFVFLIKSTYVFKVFFQVRFFIDIFSILASPGPLKYSKITVRYYKIKVLQKSKKKIPGLNFCSIWAP